MLPLLSGLMRGVLCHGALLESVLVYASRSIIGIICGKCFDRTNGEALPSTLTAVRRSPSTGVSSLTSDPRKHEDPVLRSSCFTSS